MNDGVTASLANHQVRPLNDDNTREEGRVTRELQHFTLRVRLFINEEKKQNKFPNFINYYRKRTICIAEICAARSSGRACHGQTVDRCTITSRSQNKALLAMKLQDRFEKVFW